MKTTPKKKTAEVAHAEAEKTGQDIFDTLNEETEELILCPCCAISRRRTKRIPKMKIPKRKMRRRPPMRHNAFNSQETTEENALSHSR